MSFTPYLTEPRNFLSDLDHALEHAFGPVKPDTGAHPHQLGAQPQPQSAGTLANATVAQTVAAPTASATLTQPGADRACAPDALLNMNPNSAQVLACCTRFLVLRGR